MRGTEAALWRSLAGALRPAYVSYPQRMSFTRIECTTAIGVADVDYVASPCHGWIELKVADYRGEGEPLRLHEPLKATQLDWLLTHNQPDYNLRSFLLIGVLGATTWRELFLVPADRAVGLLSNRLAPSCAILRTYPGVIVTPGPKGIVDYFANDVG